MNIFKVHVWAQIMFQDGSVSKSVRVEADVLDDETKIKELCDSLMKSVNRDTGLFVIWGGGNVYYHWITPDNSTTSSATLVSESDS